MAKEEKVYNTNLQKQIEKLIASGEITATTIAKGINIAPSTLSLYLKSNYEGRIDRIEDELEKYLSLFGKKEISDNRSLNFVETTIVDKIFKAASMCQLKGKMGVCYGDAGIGKSTAVLEYQKQNSGVILVDPIENTSTRAVLEEIANQLKIHFQNNTSTGEFIEDISKKLEKNKFIIIIDEAENLKVDIFKIIRKIHDRSKNYCGILFIGTHELYNLLNRVRNGFPYITSRIGYMAKLDELKLSDAEKLIKQYYPDLQENLVDYIAKTCKFNARAIQNLLDLCYFATQHQKLELNIDIIDSARENLLI